jgi:hypothetical protein
MHSLDARSPQCDSQSHCFSSQIGVEKIVLTIELVVCRVAAIMSLVRSAQLNGHDPYVYLKDVCTRLQTRRASAIDELLPHRCAPSTVI